MRANHRLGFGVDMRHVHLGAYDVHVRAQLGYEQCRCFFDLQKRFGNGISTQAAHTIATTYRPAPEAQHDDKAHTLSNLLNLQFIGIAPGKEFVDVDTPQKVTSIVQYLRSSLAAKRT